jgi:hypothetical protein
LAAYFGALLSVVMLGYWLPDSVWGFNERHAAANGYYNDNRRRWENRCVADKKAPAKANKKRLSGVLSVRPQFCVPS